MRITLVLLLTVLNHVAFTGSRMTVALDAISLKASTFTVGLLMSLYAVLPMLLSVSAGKLIDRVGPYRPSLAAGIAIVASVLLPFLWPGLPALFVSAVAGGTAFMVYHVALNNLAGSLGRPENRAVNFSWLALGFSTSGLLGPLAAGFAIDAVGHRPAFLLLALFPALALAPLVARRAQMPRGHHARAEAGERRVADLLRQPQLRGAFIASGVLAMGWDLYTFVIPIYGSALGLPASTIGIVMGSFSAATFTVRLAMPALIRRLKEWTVVSGAMIVAGLTYALFPLAGSAALLIALSFALGIGLGSAQPMIMSLLYSASPPGRQGEAIGVRTTLLSASQTVMPLLMGALGAALGMTPVFLSIAACLLAGGWRASRRVK